MKLLPADQLEELYFSKIIPFAEEQMKSGIWRTADNIELHYRHYIRDTNRPTITIFPGRAESALKYAEVCYSLVENGYNVFVFDHRGQGQSTRECEGGMGFVTSFDEYVNDASLVIRNVLLPLIGSVRKPHLLAHSMGGAIGTLLVQREPELFASATFCAPMYGIVAPIPIVMAKLLLWIGMSIDSFRKRRASYFFGQSAFTPQPFETNHLTNCSQRYTCFMQLHSQRTELQLGGVSHQWLHAAIDAMEKIKIGMQQISIPTQFFSAGEDTVVSIDDIHKNASQVQSSKIQSFTNAKHEILFERDETRQQAFELIEQFINSNISK